MAGSSRASRAQPFTSGSIMATTGVLFSTALAPITGAIRRSCAPAVVRGRPSHAATRARARARATPALSTKSAAIVASASFPNAPSSAPMAGNRGDVGESAASATNAPMNSRGGDASSRASPKTSITTSPETTQPSQPKPHRRFRAIHDTPRPRVQVVARGGQIDTLHRL